MIVVSRGVIFRAWSLVCLLAGGVVASCASVDRPADPTHEQSTRPAGKLEPLGSNQELEALYTADQAERAPGTAPGDWSVVAKHDRERQERVRELLDAGAVRSGRDYFHAAMVYQHADGADGVQLAHELAMIGACLGDEPSRWLAAASYDRLLMNLERPQRFATQYRSDSDGVLKLYTTSDGVTDAMRAALNVPSLRTAMERVKQVQEQLDELGKSMKAPTGEKPGH